MRRPVLLLIVGLLGLLGLIALAMSGIDAMPSYRAAWLFALAIPVGALPLVMAHDCLDRPDTPVSAALRRLLTGMPVVALLGLPVLVALGRLGTPSPAGDFSAQWTAPTFVLARSIAVLVVWVVLAIPFGRSAGSAGRRRLAGWGLALHVVLGTLAAFDWVGLIEPGLTSSSLGLLVLVGQSGIALALAALMVARQEAPTPASLAPAMLILLGAWLFLQFTQFLVVWSANLPQEVTWYLARGNGFAQMVEWLVVVMVLLVAILLLWRPGTSAIAIAAGLILFIHGTEMIWLIAPTQRGSFSLTFSDLLAALGLLSLLAGVMQLRSGAVRHEGGLGHGPA